MLSATLSSFVSLAAPFSSCFLPCFLLTLKYRWANAVRSPRPSRPALGGSKALLRVVPTVKKGPRPPRPLSSTAAVVFFLALICPPGTPRGSWFGPECSPGGRCRALREAGPSGHRARRGRHVLVANAPVSHARRSSQHDPPQRGAATSEHVCVARCRLDPRWCTERHPMLWRQNYVQWPKRVKDKRATQPAPDPAPLQRPTAALRGP